MKKRCIGPVLRVLGLLFLLDTAIGSESQPQRTAETAGATRQALIKAYGKLPFSFEANVGQSDSRVKFQARGPGYAVFLASTEAVLVIPQLSVHPASVKRSETAEAFDAPSTHPDSPGAADRPVVIRMQLVGANASPRIVGLEQLAGRTNYLRGNDPAKWQTAVPQYTRVRYESVYPGIDLVYYGNQGQLEHDFLIAPGAHPGAITVKFQGAEKLEIDGRGDLIVHVRGGEVRLPKPYIHQSDGTRIAGGYVLKDTHEVGFEIGPYDHEKPLVIDPVLVYSTHMGGGTLSDFFNRSAIAVDTYGSAYVTGGALAFPTTVGAFQTVSNSDLEVFVAKLAPDGSGLVYATFIGGSFYDQGAGIAVDANGQAYVTGQTYSRDFPTTPGAFQRTNSFGCTASNCPSDAFVAKLNDDGSALLYSTYLGGSAGDHGYGISIDGGGSAYVTGHAASSNFPVTSGTYRTASDGPFLTKLNAAGSGLVYSTFVGGGNGVAVDGAGNGYVAGWNDGCVIKLNSAASALVYSTCLGGSQGVSIRDLALDTAGNAYVTGVTRSTDFPVTSDAIQTALQGISPQGAFVSKLDAMGSLVYSTFLAAFGPTVNSSNSWGSGIAVDGSGHVYVTGSGAVPVVDPFQVFAGTDGGDAFVAELNPAVAGAAGLVFSTALAGGRTDQGHDIAVDPSGNVYVSGRTRSADFPLVDPLQSTVGGGFVAKIAPTDSHADLALAMTSAPRTAMVGGDLTYTIRVTNTGPDAAASVDVIDSLPSDGYATLAAFGASQGSCAQNLDSAARPIVCRLGALAAGGEATVTVVLRPQTSSTVRNRATVRSNVSDPSPSDNSVFLDTTAIGFTPACSGFTCHFAAAGIPPDGVFTFSWDFGDGTTGSGPTATRTYATAGSYTVTLTVTDNDGGTGTQTQTVTVPVNEPPLAWFTSTCAGLTCTFDGSSSADPGGTITDYTWDFGDGTWDSNATVSHTYAVSDFYWVTLYVTDDQGATASQSQEVFVTANATPIASFTSACIGLTCSFNASGSSDPGGMIASYTWSFGDGTTGSGATVSRTYAAGGIYTVALTVTDNAAATSQTDSVVDVSAPPVDKIAYISTFLTVSDADGSNRTQLSTGTAWELAWSPDGTRLAFTSGSHLFVVPAAGGTPVALVNWDDYLDGAAPAWSPDGTKIAFTNDGRIFVVAVAGGAVVDLTAGGQVAWSPDGTKMAFTRAAALYVINADGSSLARLTTGIYAGGRPSWSPNGTHLVFGCQWNPTYAQSDVCAIDADGSALRRLTTDSGNDSSPAWSPDGARIAFITSRYGDWTNCPDNQATQVAVMNAADGSGVIQVGGTSDGVVGRPKWSPDGTRIAFSYGWMLYIDYGNGAGYSCSELSSVAVVHADGTNLAYLDSGYGPAWRPAATDSTPIDVNEPPDASFLSTCGGLTCSFDASGSSDADGTIASYAWAFGDGTTGSGLTVSRTYVAGGAYTVTLTVTDNAAATDQTASVVNVNLPPVALFTSDCSGLACSFNASGSSDPEEMIASYAWAFGDGTTGSGLTVSRTYAAAGAYTVILTVTDNLGATSTPAQSVIMVQPNMHLGDLDRSRTTQSQSWTAIVTISVHNGSHGLVANAVVSGSWNNGSARSCTTNASGQCSVSRSGISNKTSSVSFAVTNVARATFVYTPAANHDPDGDSNGTTVTVTKH